MHYTLLSADPALTHLVSTSDLHVMMTQLYALLFLVSVVAFIVIGAPTIHGAYLAVHNGKYNTEMFKDAAAAYNYHTKKIQDMTLGLLAIFCLYLVAFTILDSQVVPETVMSAVAWLFNL
jgi:hypothetical protein